MLTSKYRLPFIDSDRNFSFCIFLVFQEKNTVELRATSDERGTSYEQPHTITTATCQVGLEFAEASADAIPFMLNLKSVW